MRETFPRWDQSYVTGDKVYCVYEPANEDLIRKHAELGRFPANKISEIKETLTPEFGEELYKGKPEQAGVNLNFS